MKHAVVLGLVLGCTWWLWSGHADALLLSFGGLSVLAVIGMTWRMRLLDDESVPVGLTLRALRYAPWLLWEIFKANLDVARRIVSPGLPIRPNVLRVRGRQRSELGRTIYANSITLTPGTVTIELDGDEFVVHALTEEAAAELRSGEMDRRVCRVEGEH